MRSLLECRPELACFADIFFARASQCFYCVGPGGLHRIDANEGVEQGDAFAPALFAYGVRRALHRAQSRADEYAGQLGLPTAKLFAYLDDMLVVVGATKL